MSHAPALPMAVERDRRHRLTLGLGLLLLAVSVVSLGTGAAGLSLADLAAALTGDRPLDQRARVILFDIRLPRLVLGLAVGAALAVAGALMQGLFRNPLADPGVIGVSAGAGLGAVAAIVLGSALPPAVAAALGSWLVPWAAFAGGWTMTVLLTLVSSRAGALSVTTLLLAGIAFGALAGAATGMLVFLADDRQLRDLTFWGLGSLSGAGWAKLTAAAPLILVALAGAMGLGRGLNAMALGEAAARHMGLRVERFKRLAVAATAALAGASVALAGGIGFVGIVVPHLLRLAAGPDHRALLPHAALLGAAVLVGADVIARSVAAPAELPIGIVTAILGAPVFLWILLRRDGAGEVRA